MTTAGQIAYDAYKGSTGGRSAVSGDPLPEWSDQRPEIRAAWEAAGSAVANAERLVIVD